MGAVRQRGPSSWLLDYRAPNGRRCRETIRAESRGEAERMLKQKEGDLARGRPLFAGAAKVIFEELTALILRDYEINRKRSIGKVRKSVERLAEVFERWRAVNITAADVGAYIEKRLRAGFSHASINRELAALKRSFRLAVKARLLSHDHVPHIPRLDEAAPSCTPSARRR